MRRRTVTMLFAVLCLSAVAWGEIPSGFINSGWLVCGPFRNPPAKAPEPGKVTRCPGLDTDYLVDHGGEAELVPREGLEQTRADGSTVAWFTYNSPEGRVAFRRAITREADVVGYAYRVITAERAGRYVLALGSDEGVRLWVNGEQVHYNYVKRGIKADDDLVPVTLKKGDNHFLVKVEQRKGGWGFIMRFLPKEEVLASVETDTARYMVNVSLRTQAAREHDVVELRAGPHLVTSAPLTASHDACGSGAAES